MFRIRRVYDDILPVNKTAIRGARKILETQFSGLTEQDIDEVFETIRNPLTKGLHGIMLVAEDQRGVVLGMAVVLRDRALEFAVLEYLAASAPLTSRGIGGALYESVREDARAFGAKGLFFECLPDDPKLCKNEAIISANRRRLAFYERYGARPIINTKYETPVRDTDTCPPHLVIDVLQKGEPTRAYVRAAVRAFLERKYKALCSPEYNEMIIQSIKDDPVKRRAPRYSRKEVKLPPRSKYAGERIALTINARHDIHHVRERGYVEAPVRIDRIREQLDKSGLFESIRVRHFSDEHVLAVHDRDFVRYLERSCGALSNNESVYPYVFPIRNQTRIPKERSVQAGYYCIDTFTPLHENAYRAARRAVDATLTAASQLLEGYRLAYSLVRPPGHHAERRSFGGFCYLNSAAIAANMLCSHGPIAILDLDYHHGNGQQQIFWERSDVLTVSLHGDPSFAYPYFSGFPDEIGEGEGEGYNVNLALPEKLESAKYLKHLDKALQRIDQHDPRFLVVCLGLDTARGDPTGTWTLEPADFDAMGERVGRFDRPVLVVQEGGYRTRSLGTNARRFFEGLARGSRAPVI